MIFALDTNIISYIMNGNDALDEKLGKVTAAGNSVVIPILL